MHVYFYLLRTINVSTNVYILYIFQYGSEEAFAKTSCRLFYTSFAISDNSNVLHARVCQRVFINTVAEFDAMFYALAVVLAQ